jgi:hypothetical protein
LVSFTSLVGKRVRTLWQGIDGQAREETCIVVEDHPCESILFPLGPEDDALAESPQTIQLLAGHPWSFPASKVVLAHYVLFFAKGREYRLLED